MHKHKKHGSHGVHGDPDRGPPMHEGAHHFDKGYVSDNEKLDPRGEYPHDHMRGNAYFKMQDEIVVHDSSKLKRSKFSKIH